MDVVDFLGFVLRFKERGGWGWGEGVKGAGEERVKKIRKRGESYEEKEKSEISR